MTISIYNILYHIRVYVNIIILNTTLVSILNIDMHDK